MDPVFIVDDLQKKQFLEGIGVRSCVCTHGLLYDLPPTQGGLGVLIEEDFKLLCKPVGDPRKLAALEQYRASPIVIVTSPTEDGVRTAAQVLNFMGQPADANAHIALPGLDANTHALWFELKHKVNPHYVAQAEARRVIDRLMGFMLTDYLGRVLQGSPLTIHHAIDRYSAHLLCILWAYQQTKNGNGGQQRVYMRQATGFRAALVNATDDADLSTLEPANFSPTQAKAIIDSLNGVPGQIIRRFAADRTLPPSPPFRFPQAVAYARAASQIQFGDICDRLTELYSAGLTTHFLPLKSDNVEVILSSLHTTLRGVRPGLHPAAAKRLQCRGLIRPRTIRPASQLTTHYPAVAALYSHIQSHTVNMVRQDLPYVSNYLLFRFRDHFFLGQEPQPLSQAHQEAGFFLNTGAQHRDGAMHVFRAGPASDPGSSPSPAPDLERFLSLFRRQFNGPQLLASLQSLISTRHYLTYEDGNLAFTERGFACMQLLNERYGPLLQADEMETTENAIRAIGVGLLDKTYYLRHWYHRFREHHEKILAGGNPR